jgi:type IV fimbrial biogenesis protein FimT
MNSPDTYRSHSLQKAFSMIELMVVVAIASILLTLAVPSFRATIDRQKLITAASDLYGAVSMTRAEAIRRGVRVDLIAQPGGWTKGWEVSVPQSTGAPLRIYTHGPLHPTVLVSKAPGFGNKLVYKGTGRAHQATDTLISDDGWTFEVNGQQRILKIEGTGRPRLCDPAAAGGCANSG